LSYYGWQHFADAVKYLEPAAKSDPGNMELHRMLAQSCLSAKNYPCALEEFRQIQEQNPDSAQAHVLTGEALDGLGKTSEAIAEFEAAVKIAPNQPNLHFGLGYLYWKSQQYDAARQEFERELALDPNHAQAMAYIGDIEWKSNHAEAALLWLKRADGVEKDLRIVYLDLAAIYMQQKDYKNAQTALLQAVAVDPALPDAHYQLGRLYFTLGKTADAEKEFRKVRELHDQADESVAGKISAAPPALNP
jgi:tetratricopeptide (TPR) repeat protein